MILRSILALASALFACTAAAQNVPQGATIGPSGYASIADVPPAPFTPRAPGPPPSPTAEQMKQHRQLARAARFQSEVRVEVNALASRLRKAERGNFIDLYFENEGEPRAVFRFKRSARATLAKYTKNPRFVAETVLYSRAELNAAMDYMLATFREDRVIMGGGTGGKRNRAEVEIAVTEPEFRALVARKGVKIPDAVFLKFAERPASELNVPLPAGISRLVRIFPRADRADGPLPDIASTAKIVLSDGCFRMPDQDNALVIFPLGASLFMDRENYLSFGPDEPGYARVGETVSFHGTVREESGARWTAPVQAACGTGKVVRISTPRSAAAERVQQARDDNAWALRNFKQSYGLTDVQAQRALERCKARSGHGSCLTSPPPPPAAGASCPAGSTLKFGICRTSEGYIRPIPPWLTELMQE